MGWVWGEIRGYLGEMMHLQSWRHPRLEQSMPENPAAHTHSPSTHSPPAEQLFGQLLAQPRPP